MKPTVLLRKLHENLLLLEEFGAATPPTAAPTPLPTPAPANPTPTNDGQQTPTGVDGDPLTVDAIIGRLNVIRGGKSFNDPEVYGQLTTFFKGLPEVDKTSLDRILSEIGKIVINVPQNQTEPEPGQPPMAPPPSSAPQAAPPPAAAPPAAPSPGPAV
jgi:hypothetical protein